MNPVMKVAFVGCLIGLGRSMRLMVSCGFVGLGGFPRFLGGCSACGSEGEGERGGGLGVQVPICEV